MAVKITFSQGGWTSSLTAVWLDVDTDKVYSDSALTTEISSVPVPTRTSESPNGYRFVGYYSTNAITGVQYIDNEGNILTALRELTAAKTIYCPSIVYSYKITLNKQGGIGGTDSFWRIKTATTPDYFFSEQECVNPISSVVAATREGYTFGGYYSSTAITGDQYIDESGNILPSLSSLSAAARTIYAKWNGNQYVLTFDYNGGTGAVESKVVTNGAAIGDLPTATKPRSDFVEWQIDGAKITSATVWNYAQNKTAVAKWNDIFGRVTDYFGIASATLIPESSDSGESKPHVVAYNATTSRTSADNVVATHTASKPWMNPSVSYRVIGDMTLSVVLGNAFAGSLTATGYMITSVTVETAIGEPPKVTISGVANEGANAIKTYTVSIPISARHRPQNLLDAIHATDNGGDLQQLSVTAECDPVVVAEDNLPCASDVCHGRILVKAAMAAYNDETEPQAANGFILVGAPVSKTGTGYKMWTVDLRKELQ